MVARGVDAIKTFAVSKRLVAGPDEAVYPCAWEMLGFTSPTACRSLVMEDPLARQMSLKDMKSSKRIKNNGRPLWKKTETVIQERIIKYTTVDPEGSCQELVESEKTQVSERDNVFFSKREGFWKL